MAYTFDGTTKSFGAWVRDLEYEFDNQQQAAESLGVSARTLRRWHSRKDPPRKEAWKKVYRRLRWRRKRKPKIRAERQVAGLADPGKVVDMQEYLPRGNRIPFTGGPERRALPGEDIRRYLREHPLGQELRKIVQGGDTAIRSQFVLTGSGGISFEEIIFAPESMGSRPEFADADRVVRYGGVGDFVRTVFEWQVRSYGREGVDAVNTT
jgi:hypothetical protein